MSSPPQDPTEVEKPKPKLPIELRSGYLRVWRSESGKIQRAKKKEELVPKDRLGTKGRLPARILIDGKIIVTLQGVKVAGDRGLGLERDGRRIRMRLFNGKAAVESYETEFIVDTPHGTVESSAAYVIIEVTEKYIKIVAIDGKLTFTNSLGSVQLGPGQTLTTAKGKKPGAPKPANMARDTQWLNRAESVENLLLNGGFEEKAKAWKFPAKTGVSTAIDEKISHTGLRSMRLTYTKSTAQTPLPPEQEVRLIAGKRYLLRVYVKSEKYTIDGRPAPVGFAVLPVPGSVKDRILGPWVNCEGRWRCIRMFFTAPSEKILVRTWRNHASKGPIHNGTVWFDDWFLGPMPEKK